MRRIVTGHDANGRAKVLIDDAAPNVRPAREGKTATLIWCTDAMPANIAIGENVEDMGARSLGTAPPACGTRFAINTTEPGAVVAFILIDAVPLGIGTGTTLRGT